jgi:hypothetical protein
MTVFGPAHHCTRWPCPICNPGYPQPFVVQPVTPPMGCICPPTSEKTCENPMCPRKGIKISASGPLGSVSNGESGRG